MTQVDLPAAELAAVFASEHAGGGAVHVEQLYAPVAAASQGIWRVRVGERTAVLKLIAHAARGQSIWQPSDETSHWYYWRREVCAYESGLLHGFADDGLHVPACLLVATRADDSIALWLEDVVSPPASTWTLARYELAARHLGRAQGAYLAGCALPEDAWLSRDWLRRFVALRDPVIASADDPVANSLRADQDRFLAALDRMPRTVCHLDLHPANLFGADNGPTTVIDWSFVGIGALGEDAGNLVPDAVLDFHVPAGDLDALYDAVVRGYTDGLHDAGAPVDEATVRLAMSATIGAKYAWIPAALVQGARDGVEMLNRRPRHVTEAAWQPVLAFLEARRAEADALLSA